MTNYIPVLPSAQHSFLGLQCAPVHNTTKYIPVLIRDGGSGLVLNGSRLESLYKLAPLSKKNAPIIFFVISNGAMHVVFLS